MSGKGYEKHLQKKVKEEHFMVHELMLELEEQRKKNSKLYQQLHQELPVLRKRESEAKILIKQMSQRITQLEMQLEATKISAKKPSVQRLANKPLLQEPLFDRKAIFKQFINDNYPKYKEAVKKALTLFLRIERHAVKTPKQRMDAYYQILGDLINRILRFIFGTKTEAQKNQSIAQKMVGEWKSSQSKFKQLLVQLNSCKAKEDAYLQQIERLEASEAQLLANKRGMESKMFAYQSSLYLKGAQFAMSLKGMLATSSDMAKEEKRKMQQILLIFSQLANKKADQNLSQLPKEPQKKLDTKAQNQFYMENSLGRKRESSGLKVRKNAPVLKKNIFGYYQNPQLNNNQPQLTLTRHPPTNKCTQTVPEDLSIISIRPVIKLTVIDGTIKPQRSRHCCNFYVKLTYNLQSKLELWTKVSVNSLQPKWNDEYLIQGYTFPFFDVDVMSQTKGLKDYSLGKGKIQVTRTEIPKSVNIKNDGEYQGRVRFMITYPKGRVYQFVLNSVKIIYPQNFPMPKDTLQLEFSLNPAFSIEFDVGERIKYFDEDFRGNNKFLIQDGYQGQITSLFEKIGHKGSVELSQIGRKQGEKQINIPVAKEWSVVLCGVLLLLISEQDEPEPIDQQAQTQSAHKYFSLLAQHPIVSVAYMSSNLPSHIKMPLVYRFDNKINTLKVYKQNSEMPNKASKAAKNNPSEVLEISPIVIPNTNFICSDHLHPISNKQLLRAPKQVYEIKIKMLSGALPVTMAGGQYLFEKLLAEVDLKCGERRFSVGGKDLLENFYITISKTLKDIGYIKFKIGYIVHGNMLKEKSQEKESDQTQIKGGKKLEELDRAQHYAKVELSTGHFPQHSSTADYSVALELGGGYVSSERSGNIVQWGESFVLPCAQPIKMKVTQYTLLGSKCIHECQIMIDETDLLLKCKFVNFGPSFLYFGRIQEVVDVYSIKIQQIEAQLNQNTDWLGQMDPYLKLTNANRTLHCTQKLQEAGCKPVWKNDQLAVLLPDDSLHLAMYDDDLIGRDDYLGECVLRIPENKAKVVQGLLRKQKEQDSPGKVILTGQFSKLKNLALYQPEVKRAKLPDIIYKITVFKIVVDDKYFNTKDAGYVRCKLDAELALRSVEFKKQANGRGQDEIRLDYSMWMKGDPTDTRFQLVKIRKNIISTKEQIFASATITRQAIANCTAMQVCCCGIEGSGEAGQIGNVHYLVEPVQSTRVLHIEGIAQQDRKLVLVSDCGDCVLLEEGFNNQAVKKSGKILMYDEKWFVLTLQEFNELCLTNPHEEHERFMRMLEIESQFCINSAQDFGLSPSKLRQVQMRAQKQRNKFFRTPLSVMLTHDLEYRRCAHPLVPPPQVRENGGVYILQHIVIKNTTTNKMITKERSSLFLIVKWADYELRIPIFSEGNNLWVCEKLLSVYVDRPMELELVEVAKDKEREQVMSIWKGQFVESSKQVNKIDPKTNLNKEYEGSQIRVVKCGSCFKYKNNWILVSCQFVRGENFPNIPILHIPELYVQIPLSNMGQLLTKKSKLKINENNAIQHELQFRVCTDRNGLQEKLLGVLVVPVEGESVLIQGRAIRVTNIKLAMAGMVLNTEQMHNSHKQFTSKFNVSSVDCWLEVFHCNKSRKELKVNTTLRSLQSVGTINCRQFSLLEPSKAIFTNKYDNANLATIYWQLHLANAVSKTAIITTPYITNKAVVCLESLIVDINDHVTAYDVDQYELYLQCVNASTRATRILKLNLLDRERKKYTIPETAKGGDCLLVVEHPQASTFILQVKAVCKKGILNRLLNKQKVLVGSGACRFDRWDKRGSQTQTVELKEVEKAGVLMGNGKAVGYIKLKYGCEKMAENKTPYREIEVDCITLEQKPEGLRIQCYSNLDKQDCEPFQIFYLEPESSSGRQLHRLGMKQSILVAGVHLTNGWPPQYRMDVYEDRSNNMLGHFTTAQLIESLPDHPEASARVETGWLHYRRWSQCLNFNQLPTAILTGSLLHVQPLNFIHQAQSSPENPGKKPETDLRLAPSQSQIADRIGQTIVRFNIWEWQGEIKADTESQIYISVESSLRVIRVMPTKQEKKGKQGEGEGKLGYGIYMYRKQVFNTNFRINICNRKWQPLYYSDVDSSQVREVGYLLFYSPSGNQQVPRVCGTCTYTVCSAYDPKLINIQEVQTFVEISNVRLESYKDTQIFSQMTPYLTLNSKYTSSIGLGKDDLFWKLCLLFPLSSSHCTNIEVCVKDKDMFFDDYIGNAYIAIDPYDVKLQMEQDRLESASRQGGHRVLRLEEYTHMYVDIKNEGKLAGRMRVEYRYVLASPCMLLWAGQKQVRVQIEGMMERMRDSNCKLGVKSFDEIAQQFVQIPIREESTQELVAYNRKLLYQSIRGPTDISGISFHSIHLSAIPMLQPAFISIASLYLPKSQPPHRYQWEMKPTHQKIKPISMEASIKVVSMLDILLPTLSQHHKMIHLSSFGIYIHKMKLRSAGSLSVYVMTNDCTAILINGVNATITLHGQVGNGPGLVSVQPTNMLIPIQFYTRDEQVLEGECRVVLHDSSTGDQYSSLISTSRMDQKIVPTALFSDSMDTVPSKPVEYLVISRVHRPAKYELTQEFLQQIGLMFANLPVIDQQIVGPNKQKPSGITHTHPISQIYPYIPLPLCLTKITVKLTILQAVLLHDIELFGKMDPYCLVYLRKDEDSVQKRNESHPIYKTLVQQNKGKLPVWNQSFFITIDATDKNSRIDFFIQDEQVTFDRAIAYGSLNLLSQIKNSSQIIKISLLDTQKKNPKVAGDLLIQISEPVKIFLLFTQMRLNSHRNEAASGINLFYEEILPNQSPNTPIDTLNFSTKYTEVRLGIMYPIGPRTQRIRFILQNKQTKKMSSMSLSVEQMLEKLYRGDGRIRMVSENIQVGYLLGQENSQTRSNNMIKQWQKAKEGYENAEIKTVKDDNDKVDNFQFILEEQSTVGRKKQEEGIFILEQQPKPNLFEEKNHNNFILEMEK